MSKIDRDHGNVSKIKKLMHIMIQYFEFEIYTKNYRLLMIFKIVFVISLLKL